MYARTLPIARLRGTLGLRPLIGRFFRTSAAAFHNNSHVEHFKSFLSGSQVITDPEALAVKNTDWMRKFRGQSTLLLRPKSADEVSRILQYCNEHDIKVVPQGGNTGLVGGSVPKSNEVILSMELMNKVLSFDEQSGVLACEAGCILEDLDRYLEEHGYMMPLDLGAKGSCHIGGNVSTNAGGIRYIRYGSLHGSVLGLECVTADGTVLDMMSSLRKDNVGYDMKQLFIGSEGSLGVITKVSIQTPRRPKTFNVAVLGCKSFEEVCKTLAHAKKDLGEVLSAVEFVDRKALTLVLEHVEGTKDPLAESYPFYVLIETAGSNETHDSEKLNGFLEAAMEEALVYDGVVAQDTAQAKQLWKLRESVAVGLGHRGAVYKYDVSLPLQSMYSLVEIVRERIEPKFPDAHVVGYGHVGDCNLHLNVSVPEESEEIRQLLEPFIYDYTNERRGSISAEHGLGQMKNKYLPESKSPEVVALMKKLKAMMDPKGILNPGKVLPPE